MRKLVDKIMVITVTDSRNYPNHFWEEPLKNNCKKLIWFDLKKVYFENGRAKTQNIILNLFKKEKPDYLFMFDSLFYDLDLPILLTKLKKVSPKTRSVFFSGDDDFNFNSTRYSALFFDYHLAVLENFIPLFKKDGLRTFFIVQTKPYKNFTNKKIYDVSFIGTPKADRKEFIEYLLQNKVNIRIFGYNWDNYPKLKSIYGGVLSSEDYLRTIEQTKINLCFSKNMRGVTNMKGRFLEISNCKTFSLVEYFPYLAKLFEERKEIVFFRTKKELLEKINYYLEHEKEREKIAEAAYKKVNSKFDFEKKIQDFIKKTSKDTFKKSLPKLEYSIINLDEKLMRLSKEKIIQKIKDYDYISFSKGQIIKSSFKNYLQAYSLKKNNKGISCCDYFIYSKYLGDYMRFRYCPFGKEQGKNLSPFLNINQIIMTKQFFIKNYEVIKRAYETGSPDFINNRNTAFISIPLVSITNFSKGFFNNTEFSNELGLFLFSAHRELYSKRKKPIKFIFYALSLIREGLSGKKFIFHQLKLKLLDKETKKLIKG